jgi:MIP family channel proteins
MSEPALLGASHATANPSPSNAENKLPPLARAASTNDLRPGSSINSGKEQQQQQEDRLVSMADESTRSQASAPSTPNVSANRPRMMTMGLSTGSPANAGAGRQTRKQLTDSGIESSAQMSSDNNEAQRLLDLSGASNKSCFCNSSSQQQSGHFRPAQPRPNQAFTAEQQQQLYQQRQQLSSMSLQAQSLRLLPAYFVAELVGTFLLVLIGDGALASYVFTNKPVDSFSVCLAFGVGAMIASYVSIKLSGAHFNPAATLALALDNQLKWELVPIYIVAQYVGGFLAALVLFLNYSEAINAMDGGNHSAWGANHSTGGVFATYPAPYVTVWGSLIDQIVGTAVLLFCLAAIGDKLNMGLEDRFQPPIVALAIGLVCFAFSVNCGAIFNPARDLSPRLLTALLGYPGVWKPIDGTYWIVAGVVGPHIGAILGVFAYKYLIGTALEASARHLQSLRDSGVAGTDGETTATSMAGSKQAGSGLSFDNHLHHSHPYHHPHHHHNHHNHHRYHDTNGHYHHHHQNDDTPLAQVKRRSDVTDYGSAVKS